MFRRNMSIEQKKKRAKIAWLAYFSVFVLVMVLRIVFNVDIIGFSRSLDEPSNEFLVAAMVVFAPVFNGYLFYTLLSIMIETQWRNLGKIMMVVLVLNCGGLAIAGVVRIAYLLVT